MKIRYGMAATGACLLLLAGCGGGNDTPGQPSADERGSLDNVAKKLDDQQTIDTSPDSMVPADEAAVTGNGAAATPASPPSNSASPAANASNGATAR